MSTSTLSLPSLIQWTEGHLKAMFDATSEEAFDTAFDAFISRHVHINVNGKHITREQYKQLLLGEKTFGTTATPCDITFDGAVEVPADRSHPTMAGTVGLFYKATITGRYMIMGALCTNTVHSSLNVVVTPDTSLIPEGTGYTLDPRRVSHLTEVVLEQENPAVPTHRPASRRGSLTSPPPDVNATTVVSASA